MMDIITTQNPLMIPLLVSAGIGLMALLMAVYNGRTLLALRRQLQQEQHQQQDDMKAMSKSAVGMGHKLMDMDKRLNDVLKKQFALLNSQPEHPSYDQASRLIAMGASARDLTNACGFSQAEAELLMSLQRQRHEQRVH